MPTHRQSLLPHPHILHLVDTVHVVATGNAQLHSSKVASLCGGDDGGASLHVESAICKRPLTRSANQAARYVAALLAAVPLCSQWLLQMLVCQRRARCGVHEPLRGQFEHCGCHVVVDVVLAVTLQPSAGRVPSQLDAYRVRHYCSSIKHLTARQRVVDGRPWRSRRWACG